MVSWTNLEALAPGNPLKALARRSPAYYNRYAGDVDQFGFSLETFARWEPIFRFLFEDYFQVKVQGLENIPGHGRAILVGNHSGLLPLDGAMISMAMCHSHPFPRRIRFLATDWFFTLPGVGDWIRETACEDQIRILADLCYSKRTFRPVRWVLAVAKDSPCKSAEDLKKIFNMGYVPDSDPSEDE